MPSLRVRLVRLFGKALYTAVSFVTEVLTRPRAWGMTLQWYGMTEAERVAAFTKEFQDLIGTFAAPQVLVVPSTYLTKDANGKDTAYIMDSPTTKLVN